VAATVNPVNLQSIRATWSAVVVIALPRESMIASTRHAQDLPAGLGPTVPRGCAKIDSWHRTGSRSRRGELNGGSELYTSA
jgi:hypothetical protein